jgi:crossover junction endodeoxyribonuclease RuvC
VLGIDPGSRVTGWGVVERTPVNQRPGGSGKAPRSGATSYRLVACGTLRPKTDATFPQRLAHIHAGVEKVLREHAPHAVAVEEAFAGLNVRTAIRLGEARAVCILAAEQAGRSVHELSPALVKKVVAGHGGAGKDAVRNAILRVLGAALPGAATLTSGEDLPAHDASDALALALAALTRLDVAPGLQQAGLPVGRKAKRRGWTLEDVESIRRAVSGG